MSPTLAAEIANGAFALLDLAIEKWRESAAYRAAKLQAWLGLDDAERRAQRKSPRKWRVKRWRLKRLWAAAVAHEITKEQCDCLIADVAKRVDAAVHAAIAAARAA